MTAGIRRCLLATGLLLGACGGDSGGGGGGSSSGGSYGDIADAIAEPTGMVDESSAKTVAEEFQKISASGVGGVQKQSGSGTMECPAGGSVSYQAEGSSQSASASFDYNDCCYEASCCINGSGTWFYSATAGASYSYCGSYDLTVSCGAQQGAVSSYEGCFGSEGWVYVVRVEGETFAVTGQYSDGSGELTISGANGTFTCSYSGGTGSCSDSSGGSFSF